MDEERDVGELLRAHGLRVTPQRRAILGAFSGAATEHLSADEVHARAAAVIPEIGRGTVYSALAELTELEILTAQGGPEPVRYETNSAAHQHFRCRLCLRLFDVAIAEPRTDELRAAGFVVERMMVTAEGVCGECVGYDAGLRAGARQAREEPTGGLPEAGIAVSTIDTPVGRLTVGASSDGVVRVVFDSHADVPALHDAMRRRHGGPAARRHVADAKAAIARSFAGQPMGECAIDWSGLPGAQTLRSVTAVPRATDISYEALDTPAGAQERGRVLGANPVAILVPCHRVTRGREIPAEYVGGPAQRIALRQLERR
jgi:Fur family ferric uptake transcriptional regulator